MLCFALKPTSAPHAMCDTPLVERDLELGRARAMPQVMGLVRVELIHPASELEEFAGRDAQDHVDPRFASGIATPVALDIEAHDAQVVVLDLVRLDDRQHVEPHFERAAVQELRPVLVEVTPVASAWTLVAADRDREEHPVAFARVLFVQVARVVGDMEEHVRPAVVRLDEAVAPAVLREVAQDRTKPYHLFTPYPRAVLERAACVQVSESTPSSPLLTRNAN